ncbi:hypothetical protein DVH24_007220 [Malus domestica]|uniref:Uncharacterized protein n=1 Tax=Malus domestica TaxID=3750 RepID=A0A498HI17_MALDO|nr:hypothetical protein DVH24_007220 [Malus domestica]
MRIWEIRAGKEGGGDGFDGGDELNRPAIESMKHTVSDRPQGAEREDDGEEGESEGDKKGFGGDDGLAPLGVQS